MSRNVRSEESHLIYVDRRLLGRERTLERHAERVAKMSARTAFGGAL